jgi:tight adherence protein B
MSRVTVLLACCTALLLLGASAVLVLRVQGERERLHRRVMRVTTPYQRRATATVVATTGVGLDDDVAGAARWLAKLFGFDPALREHYPLPWWVVLLGALTLAGVERVMVASLLSHASWLMLLPSWVWTSRQFFAWCERRRRDKLFVQFPDALAMIVRAVRVGVPVTQSIRAVGREIAAPTGPEFTKLADELAIGVTLEDALKTMAERNGLREYRFFATALTLQTQTGGGLSETLENLADVIRKRVALRQKGQALAAEAKTSAGVLAALPLVAGVGLWVLNSEYIDPLFTESGGHKILAVAAGALGGGILTMRSMIRRSLS